MRLTVGQSFAFAAEVLDDFGRNLRPLLKAFAIPAGLLIAGLIIWRFSSGHHEVGGFLRTLLFLSARGLAFLAMVRFMVLGERLWLPEMDWRRGGLVAAAYAIVFQTWKWLITLPFSLTFPPGTELAAADVDRYTALAWYFWLLNLVLIALGFALALPILGRLAIGDRPRIHKALGDLPGLFLVFLLLVIASVMTESIFSHVAVGLQQWFEGATSRIPFLELSRLADHFVSSAFLALATAKYLKKYDGLRV